MVLKEKAEVVEPDHPEKYAEHWDQVATLSPKSCRTIPAAIWLRAALAVQRNSTFIFASAAMDTSCKVWNSVFLRAPHFRQMQQYPFFPFF